MKSEPSLEHFRISFIGSAGIPNRYGGFESFLEHCAPVIVSKGHKVQVTCDAKLYDDHTTDYNGVERIFLKIPANGGWSLVHDLLAFLKTYQKASHIVVLGVSGGFWFPIFRLLSDFNGNRLLVNVDGVEWRRTKFGPGKRFLLKVLDLLAQKFAHAVIYDNSGLYEYLIDSAKSKSICIGYSGDHVQRLNGVNAVLGTALTICRIEPENNLEMLIEGALLSNLLTYTIIGNWDHSLYARQLRKHYAKEKRLLLLDPIYNASQLAELRESCWIYIHGHSVGGTNPSLVEMLFYDCTILCFDVIFNRQTAGNASSYFNNSKSLSLLIESIQNSVVNSRLKLREQFTAEMISNKYLYAMKRSF